MKTTEMPPTHWRRWMSPAVALGLGLALFVAGVLGDNLQLGVLGLVLMIAVGAVLALAGRRSETVGGLLDRRDERINHLDATASQTAGMVVGWAVIIMFLIELASGQDGTPYAQLAALGGATYVVALVALRYRR